MLLAWLNVPASLFPLGTSSWGLGTGGTSATFSVPAHHPEHPFFLCHVDPTASWLPGHCLSPLADTVFRKQPLSPVWESVGGGGRLNFLRLQGWQSLRGGFRGGGHAHLEFYGHDITSSIPAPAEKSATIWILSLLLGNGVFFFFLMFTSPFVKSQGSFVYSQLSHLLSCCRIFICLLSPHGPCRFRGKNGFNHLPLHSAHSCLLNSWCIRLGL